MQVVRYLEAAGATPRVGVSHDGEILALAQAPSLAALWALGPRDRRELLERAVGDRRAAPPGVTVLAPVDGRTEVWAAGVTYEISRDARVEESEQSADVYERVYLAERPELFFKSVPWKVVGDGGTISVRSDSTLDVPEPELAVVVNASGEVVGYTICDDVSSRSIEGENPLYLPQAKVYLGGCALGPGITPAWEVPDPYSLAIELTIERAGTTAWSGTTSTRLLRRRLDELSAYLGRADVFPDGFVLSTGTCLVPEAPFCLSDGDSVRVTIEGLGTLVTSVVRGLPPYPGVGAPR
ncbi:MAG: fumarylacetoacetate hydrolase family protein [Actinomycetota bacterium]|nr:fumarylacetoacetate hydrolase family protein [Actinomycetota bacterium]